MTNSDNVYIFEESSLFKISGIKLSFFG